MKEETIQAIDEMNEYYYKTNRPGEKFILQYHRYKNKTEHALTLACKEIDAKESILTKIKEALPSEKKIKELGYNYDYDYELVLDHVLRGIQTAIDGGK